MLVMPRPLLSNAQLQTGNTRAIGVLAEHVPRSMDSARMEDILASSRVHALMRQLLQWKRSIFSNPPFGAAVLWVKPRNRVHVRPVQIMGIRDRCGTGADPWMPGKHPHAGGRGIVSGCALRRSYRTHSRACLAGARVHVERPWLLAS